MKIIHRMVLRMLPGPFFGALGTLMFLLLLQFLMRHLKDLVGKGLPTGVVVELIVYNLAYMVVLAVPMSVLLSVVATFARMSETGAYVVVRNAGVSPIRLMWPVAVAGGFVMLGMTYFNNVTLPDANYLAKGLWQDIRQKRPGFALEAGVFYEGIRGYALRAMRIPEGTNELYDITIFDYGDGARRRTSINARRGTLETTADGARLIITVFDGEVHRLHTVSQRANMPQRYERMSFDRLVLPLDLSTLAFERSDPGTASRSDRTMRTGEMLLVVDSLRNEARLRREEFQQTMARIGPVSTRLMPDKIARAVADTMSQGMWDGQGNPPSDWSFPIFELDTLVQNELFDFAMQNARVVQTDLENIHAGWSWSSQRADRYMVEVHKKYSIAVACLVFVLIGAPLVVLLGRGSLGFVTALSAGIFVFYWVTLVLGEKLSDRGDLRPWLGMWIANIVIFSGAVFLFLVLNRIPARIRRAIRRRRLPV